MICHQSRIETDKSESGWLEKWNNFARDLGTRALADLRTGVTKSIESLGHGFLEHPRNDRLREKLQSGELCTQDYYWLSLPDLTKAAILAIIRGVQASARGES